MASGTLAEATRAMDGRLVEGRPGAPWSGALLDSRKAEGGELFFALAGEHRDGHDYVNDALRRGAAAAVVQRPVPPSGRGGLIQVNHTLEALHALTRSVRRRLPEHLLALTGSTGKTTTKEVLAELLAVRFKVARNPGNLNNQLGFPLALLGTPEGTQWLVAEMGMSARGELAALSRLARPDVVLLTNVRPVHLEGLGSLEAVAEAKAEILTGLPAEGQLVANGDDPWVRRIAARHPGRVLWFALEGEADYRATDLRPRPEGAPGTHFRLHAPGGEITIELPLHGRYNVENFLAAAACAHALGVPLAELATAAQRLQPVAGRGVIHRLAGGITIVDDSYNSNPVAVQQALESAATLPAQRRWAVLGDMLELGAEAAEYHRAAGRSAVVLGFGPVVGVGELCRELVAGVVEAGGEGVWFAHGAEAAEWAVAHLEAGDLVVVKGSRGVRLESVVRALLEGRG
jgi:UDP-N-acetylmuramoyl-tripeptide--D-alanyl-D-alanine ligase